MTKALTYFIVAMVWWFVLLIPCAELHSSWVSVFMDIWIAVTSLSVFFGLIGASYFLVKSAD